MPVKLNHLVIFSVFVLFSIICRAESQEETERRLIDEYKMAEQSHGLMSKENLFAVSRLVDFYEGKPDKRKKLKDALGTLMFLVQNKYGNWQILYPVYAKMTTLELEDEEYEDAVRDLSFYLMALRWNKEHNTGNGGEAEEILAVNNNLAMALVRLNRFEEAEKEFKEIILLLQNRGDDDSQEMLANVLQGWTKVCVGKGEYIAAVEKSLQSLAITRKLKNADPSHFSARLKNVVFALKAAGRNDEAKHYEDELDRLIGSAPEDVAQSTAGLSLRNQSKYFASTGKYDKAIATAQRELESVRKATTVDGAAVADAKINLAEIYLAASKPKDAIPLLVDAVQDEPGRFDLKGLRTAHALVILARSRDMVEDSGGALRTADHCLKILKDIDANPSSRTAELANLFNEVAGVYGKLAGYFPKADPKQVNGFANAAFVELLQNAQYASERGKQIYADAGVKSTHSDMFVNLIVTAFSQLQSGAFDEAIATSHQIIERAAESPYEAVGVVAAQEILSISYAGKKDVASAILWGKVAVNNMQGLRKRYEANGKFLGQSSEGYRFVYETLATLLVHEGNVAEAQTVLKMLKERELYEDFRGTADDPRTERIELTGVEQKQFARFYELRNQQVDLAKRRAELERTQLNSGSASANDVSKQIDKIKSDQAELASAMHQFLKQLEQDMTKLPRDVVQNAANLKQQTSELSAIINQLAISEPAAAAAALQYIITEETLTIILTIPKAPPIAHQLPIDRAKLYSAIKVVATQLQSPNADPKLYETSLKDLYEMLIAPVSGELEKVGARTLMLSLDDRLRLLPFAALLDKNHRYLLERYTLALYNEAAKQDLSSSGAAGWSVAAMGLSKAVDDLPALTSVPEELSGILKAPGVKGVEYLDGQFNRQALDTVLSHKASQPFNVLHIASHFKLRPGNAAQSILYLGDGTRMSLADLDKQAARFEHFDLVTYSACQTAVAGGRDTAGSAVESLSAKTQRMGAQSVMATLWKVDDRGTTRFMERFYALHQSGVNKAQALRNAQLEMIKGGGKEKDNWRSPYYWAPFVVAGNWR